MTGRNLFTASALALVAVVAACSESSNNPATTSLGPTMANVGAVGVVDTGEFELCKHGTSGTFNYSVDGGGSQSVTLADGECAVLAANSNLGAGTHNVSVTEVADAAIVLDSIVPTKNTIFLPGGTRGAPITGTSTYASNYNGDNGVLVEFYNSPAPPPPPGGCTFTLGYWKNHLSAWPAAFSPNATFYTSGQTWIQVLNTSPKGNAYYILAHQFIAATLNVANGATAPANIAQTLSDAATYFQNPGGSTLTKTQLTAMATLLDNWNQGLLGNPHCP
jgi:hypothetical protein